MIELLILKLNINVYTSNKTYYSVRVPFSKLQSTKVINLIKALTDCFDYVFNNIYR